MTPLSIAIETATCETVWFITPQYVPFPNDMVGRTSVQAIGDWAIGDWSLPETIVVDNGSEFAGRANHYRSNAGESGTAISRRSGCVSALHVTACPVSTFRDHSESLCRALTLMPIL
jgi:hypothetical protein